MPNLTFEARIPDNRVALIAVVDDDPDIRELVSVHVKKAGMKVREFGDAEGLYRFLREETPDLLILDLMLPDGDGIEICRFLRKEEKFATLPVIMVTARVDEVDRVLGLEIGADDYITKPFSPKELVARVKAVLRRTEPQHLTEQKIQIGTLLVMDLRKHEVKVEDEPVVLTPVEFRILYILASRRGWVLTREKMLDLLWGHDKTVSDRTVDVHILHLREKLGPASHLIKNVRGIGYKLEA